MAVTLDEVLAVFNSHPSGQVVAAVIVDGELWTAGDPATVFRAASVTKTFLAAATLRIVDAGVLGLDDQIAPLVATDLKKALAEAGYAVDRITVRQLLGHTSGLRDHSSAETFHAAVRSDPQHVWTRAEQVAHAVELGRPLCAPGAAMHYSDTGYVLLGAAVERATGRDLGDAVSTYLDLASLARSTRWETRPVVGPRFPQRLDGVDIWDIHPSVDLFGGGGLVTTTLDLATFIRHLLGGRVLDAESRATMLSRPAANAAGHGLGIMAAPGRAELWGHLGFWGTAMLGSLDGRIGIGVAVTPAPASGGVDPGVVALRLYDAVVAR